MEAVVGDIGQIHFLNLLESLLPEHPAQFARSWNGIAWPTEPASLRCCDGARDLRKQCFLTLGGAQSRSTPRRGTRYSGSRIGFALIASGEMSRITPANMIFYVCNIHDVLPLIRRTLQTQPDAADALPSELFHY